MDVDGSGQKHESEYYLIPYDYGGSNEKYIIDPHKKTPLVCKLLVWGIVLLYWYQFLTHY